MLYQVVPVCWYCIFGSFSYWRELQIIYSCLTFYLLSSAYEAFILIENSIFVQILIFFIFLLFSVMSFYTDRGTRDSWKYAYNPPACCWRVCCIAFGSKAWGGRKEEQYSAKRGARCCIQSCTWSRSGILPFLVIIALFFQTNVIIFKLKSQTVLMALVPMFRMVLDL